MDLLIEFIKISKALKAKLSSAGRNSLRFKRIVCQRADDGAFPTQILTLIFAGFFACYPPESFKIICLTCIWLNKARSSQTPPQISTASDGHIFKFFKNRCVKLKTRWGLELGT